jgi:hypothetical protein
LCRTNASAQLSKFDAEEIVMRLLGISTLAAGLAGCVYAPPYDYGFYEPAPAYAYTPPSYYGWPGYYGYPPYGYAPAYYAAPRVSLGIGFFGGYGGYGHGHRGHGGRWGGGHRGYSSPRAIHGHH